MGTSGRALVLGWSLLGGLWLGGEWGEGQLDRYGGTMNVVGTPSESFHLEKLGDRWCLVTPEGHGMFIRAVSKTDISDHGGSGGNRAAGQNHRAPPDRR